MPSGSGQAAVFENEPGATTGHLLYDGTVSAANPFWHRLDPVLAAVRIDARYERLQQIFPASWPHLVDAKALIDAVTSLEASYDDSDAGHLRVIRPLVLAAADKLTQFSLAEEAGPCRSAALQALTAADRLRAYAQTGAWPLATLSTPESTGPWLYCGPLGTWAFRACYVPLSLLVVTPRPDLQASPDAVDADMTVVRGAVTEALGGAVWFTQVTPPTMHAMDLLIVGGELASGHKHFAHFFPLESPAANVDGPEFTITFANVHEHRLRRCSLELLGHYTGGGQPRPAHEVVSASLTWFRCHDLAHFWRRQDTLADGIPESMLNHAERMTFEEGYADVLGLISAAALSSDAALAPAFAAEMLRYLSRNQARFADSAAAAMTIGWLIENGVSQPLGSTEWLDAGLPALRELSRVLHRVRWEGQMAELPKLRAALRVGARFCDGLSPLFATIPTDLEYIFG